MIATAKKTPKETNRIKTKQKIKKQKNESKQKPIYRYNIWITLITVINLLNLLDSLMET